jgi:hypothetical protein
VTHTSRASRDGETHDEEMAEEEGEKNGQDDLALTVQCIGAEDEDNWGKNY